MAKRRWLRIENQGYGMIVAKELLGQTITFPLGTAQATIVFPRALANEVPKAFAHFAGVECFLSLKDIRDAGFSASNNMEEDFGSLHCGGGYTYQNFLTPEGLESAELRRFVYFIEAEWASDATSNDAMWVLWNPFWALCKDWLEILTGQDINSGSTHSSKGSQSSTWTENGDGAEAQKHGHADAGGSSPLIASKPVSWLILESSLDRAIEGTQIPLDDRLFRDARRSINLGDFRKSVIDCASAIEIVLSKELVKLYLAEGETQARIDHLEKAMLGEVIDTWNAKGTHKFPNLSTSVSDLRNGIIHRGLTCSSDEAIFVYDLTREILVALGTRAVP